MIDQVVKFAGVSYRYPRGAEALHEVDLNVEAGEFVVLAGASGSGKSTLCRLLNGIIPHHVGGQLMGSVVVLGNDVLTTSPAQLSRNVGVVFQNPEAQLVARTVAREIAFGLLCQGIDRREIAERVEQAAAQVDVAHLLARETGSLSGGEQQRVALAGVLACRPAVLVLDEPYAFLDAGAADRLREILKNLHRSGVTVIVSEHRLADVVEDATRLVILHNGTVVADGPPPFVVASGIERWGLERPFGGSMELPLRHPVRLAPGTVPAVSWQDVTYRRDAAMILQGATLEVNGGEIQAVLGANGAGKTTLLRHANGLLRATGGTVLVAGQPVARRPVAELARSVGLVMQQPAHMLFAPTVAAELAAGPRALGRDDQVWRDMVIERVGLSALLDRPPQQLSAGEQRRVAIAAILAARPATLVLDEPTAGLDAAGRRAVGLLLAQCADDGMAIILSTHDVDWAYRVAGNWAIMDAGRIVVHGPSQKVGTRVELLRSACLRVPAMPRPDGVMVEQSRG